MGNVQLVQPRFPFPLVCLVFAISIFIKHFQTTSLTLSPSRSLSFAFPYQIHFPLPALDSTSVSKCVSFISNWKAHIFLWLWPPLNTSLFLSFITFLVLYAPSSTLISLPRHPLISWWGFRFHWLCITCSFHSCLAQNCSRSEQLCTQRAADNGRLQQAVNSSCMLSN